MSYWLTEYKRLTEERKEAHNVCNDELCDSLGQQLDTIWWDSLSSEEQARIDPYDRPNYIKCVRLSGSDANATTVCGRTGVVDWLFTDWEHADGNAANEGRLITCEQCLAKREGASV